VRQGRRHHRYEEAFGTQLPFTLFCCRWVNATLSSAVSLAAQLNGEASDTKERRRRKERP